MPNTIPPQILDINGNMVAVLQNAYKIGYQKVKNGLWTCSFSLPLNDSKVEHVKPKFFVELYDYDKRIGRFIVNPKHTVKNESTNEITFRCEHVLALLHSDILFRYHQFTNYPTRYVLQSLMDLQEIKHWRLGEIAFERWFHYSWENEDSLLNGITSVPKPFDVPYLWTWDDSTYPFTLNLIEPSNEIKDIVAAGKNLKGIEIEEDPTNLVTRIYPLGAGEGINQLDITKVNNGVPYLQDNVAVAEYGIHKRVWVDNRFENAESLMASAQAILDKFNKPIKSVAIDCIDYRLIDPYKLSNYEVGDVLQVYDQDTNTHEEIRLEKIDKSDIYGAPQDIKLELGSVFEDISTTFTELQKKQLVNETYSQGATNIDSRDFADNCDPSFPAVIRFPIPDDVVNINEMVLTFETQRYRAYSKAIKGGGAVVTSTSAGGGVTTSSGSGGAVVTSTSGGGGVVTSTGSGGGSVESSSAENYRPGLDGHNHNIPDGTLLQIYGQDAFRLFQDSGQHEHTIRIPHHDHSVELWDHAHDVTLEDHTHSVIIPNHTHEIELPDHTHEIEHGIFEYGSLPTTTEIIVDGNVLPFTETSGEQINLIPYLAKDSGGRIQRGRYAEIIIKPNDLARINATVSSRLFIQSRIGVKM